MTARLPSTIDLATRTQPRARAHAQPDTRHTHSAPRRLPAAPLLQFSEDFFEEINMTREEFDEQYVVLNHW